MGPPERGGLTHGGKGRTDTLTSCNPITLFWTASEFWQILRRKTITYWVPTKCRTGVWRISFNVICFALCGPLSPSTGVRSLILKRPFYRAESQQGEAEAAAQGVHGGWKAISSSPPCLQTRFSPTVCWTCSLFCLSIYCSFCWWTTPSLACGSAELSITPSCLLERGTLQTRGKGLLFSWTLISKNGNLGLAQPSVAHGQPLQWKKMRLSRDEPDQQMKRVIRKRKEDLRTSTLRAPGSRGGQSVH